MVDNKGGRRSYVSQVQFWIRGIEGDRPLVHRKDHKLVFPNQYAGGKFVSPRDEWLFVDSGTTQAFTFPAIIMDFVSLILVRVKISPKGGYRYTEERVFEIPAPGSETQE